MKKVIFILCVLSVLTEAAHTENEKIVKSKIDRVTVFLQGAQIFRTSPVSAGSGTTHIVFESLEPDINIRSVQATGIGNFIIMDVQHSIKHYISMENKEPSKTLRTIKLLEDSLVLLDFEKDDLAYRKEALTTEKNTLLNNKIIKGTSGDTLPTLKGALEYLRIRLNNINTELLKVKREEYYLELKRKRIQNRVDELNLIIDNKNIAPGTEINYQIIVTIYAEAAISGSIKINYFLNNAGWIPAYDLRAKNAGGPVQLMYKANVFQNTGTDWNNVKLTLSTLAPDQANNNRPILQTYWINYNQRYGAGFKNKSDQLQSIRPMDLGATSSSGEMVEVEEITVSEYASDYTEMNEIITNVEFDIKLPYTILSNKKQHLVVIKNEEVPSTYTHYLVPKLDADAFLLARLTGWEELKLLPGKVNVYFESTFVGETRLDPNSIDDTLEITLGREKSIITKRIRLKNKTVEVLMGEEKIRTIEYEISIKNSKAEAVIIILEDQIPVSSVKEIMVELVDASGAKYNKDNGKLEWKVNVKAKETKKIKFSYKVRYPRDKLITNL